MKISSQSSSLIYPLPFSYIKNKFYANYTPNKEASKVADYDVKKITNERPMVKFIVASHWLIFLTS